MNLLLPGKKAAYRLSIPKIHIHHDRSRQSRVRWLRKSRTVMGTFETVKEMLTKNEKCVVH